MSDSIQVAIKVRPLIKREKDDNLQIQWAVVDNVIVPVDPEKKRGESGFQFDHIFGPEKSNNDVFETVVKPIVDAAVKGFNGTVFAYGQTSSGKTHTMFGTPSELGIIPMAVEHTFDSIVETCGREFLLRVSYLEIYNEKVNDLLEPSGQDLRLREDSNGLVQVLKCKEEIASSPDVIMDIMKKGDKNRRIGETDMNERSSRSHSIFRITIESRDQSSDSDGAIQVSQLNLVDLAGSERARQTNATGERFKEGTHINMSLSTLGLVIKQLSESSDSTKYINFRDSKLTRLLQASLGGNAMTTIICAVTPAAFEETQCTLWFASRAKSVKNKPQLNEVMSDAALLKRYKKQLAKLNEELERLKQENRIEEVQEMESKLQEKEHKLQETDRINQLLEERIQLLQNGIISAESATKEDTDTKIPKFNRRRTWAGNQALNARFSLAPRNLSPIKERPCTNLKFKSNNTENFNNMRRKSIIQTLNLSDESFETAFTDFELELIKVAKEREEQISSEADCTEEQITNKEKAKSENRVKFQDHVEIHRLSCNSTWSDQSTPEKRRSTSSQGDRTGELMASPGTPKAVLRERLNYITDEYNTLQEFTTLERQILSAQQADFQSPNEKIFLQKQMDGLLERLAKYSRYQTELEEQLALSLNCINELSLKTPDILELWNPSLFNDKGEGDTLNELKNLQHLLRNLKNKQSNAEKVLTPLEEQLTNDYNKCCKELEQVQSQKELLINENSDLKKKLLEESNKLKTTDTLVNTLRTDTDCLMEKLIQKNSELAKLKERVVELERISNEIEKSGDINALEISMTKTNIDQKSLNSGNDASDSKDIEISRLNEIIQEKVANIAKYRQFEEEMRGENECLQQSLDAITKVEQNSIECQTETILNSDNENEIQEKDNEISKLSTIIQTQALSITNYQQLETQMKQKIEELHRSIDNLSKVELIFQDCQTEPHLKDNTLPGFDEELKIENETLKQKVQELQSSLKGLSKIEVVSQDGQTESISKDASLREIVEESEVQSYNKSIESTSEEAHLSFAKEAYFIESISELKLKNDKLKQKIQELRNSLENYSKVDIITADQPTENISKNTHLIESIEELQLENNNLKQKIEELQQSNIISSKIEVTSQDCLAENISEVHLREMNEKLTLENSNLKQRIEELNYSVENLSKAKEPSLDTPSESIFNEAHLKETIQEINLENSNLKQKIQELQHCLENYTKIDVTTQNQPSESVFEDAHLKQTIEELKLENSNLKQKIDELQHSDMISLTPKVPSPDCLAAGISTEETHIREINEKLILENNNLKQRIEELNCSLENLSKAKEPSLYTQSISNEAHLKETIIKINIENSNLKQNIEELQSSLEDTVKVDAIAQDQPTESVSEDAHLIEIIEELKLENSNLKQKIDELQLSETISSKTKVASQDRSAEGDSEEAHFREINEKLILENNSLKQRIEELNYSLENLPKNEAPSLDNQTESISNEAHLKEKIEEINLENSNLKQKIQELQNYLENYTKVDVITHDQPSESVSEDAHLKKVIEELKLENNNLKHKIKEQQDSLEYLSKDKGITQDSLTDGIFEGAYSRDIVEELKMENNRLKQSIKELQDFQTNSLKEDVISEGSQIEGITEETYLLEHIEEVKLENIKLKEKIQELQSSLENFSKDEVKSQICLSEGISEKVEDEQKKNSFYKSETNLSMTVNETLVNLKSEKLNEMEPVDNKNSSLSCTVSETDVQQFLHTVTTDNIENAFLDEKSLIGPIHLTNIEKTILAKDSEICQLTQIIDEKTLSIMNYQQLEVKMRQKIAELEHDKNFSTKVEGISQICQTEDVSEEVILKQINEKLKIENEDLKKRLEILEIEVNKSLTIHKNLSLGETPIISTEVESLDANNSSINVNSLIVLIEDNAPISTTDTADKIEISATHNSRCTESAQLSILETGNSISVSLEPRKQITANDDNNFAKPLPKNNELESSSIFANMSYFDNMEVGQSFVQDCTTLLTGIDKSRDASNVSINIDTSLPHHGLDNKSIVNATVLCDNNESMNKSENIQSISLVKVKNKPLTIEEFTKAKEELEKENARLCYDLQKKIHETEEVQRVIKDFKQTLEELQETICILTNENMDMSKLLTEARENNNQIANDFQREIDILTARLSAITDEKTVLRSKMLSMNEEFENARTVNIVITDDEIKCKFTEYDEKIKILTEENIELSTNLMEKIEELEKVKESKIQMFDHECTYKEKCDSLIEKIQCIEKENIELSNDLTEQIEECDKLRETANVIKQQLEAYTSQRSENSGNNDLDFFKRDNARLTNEMIELRAKLTQLSRENANLSSNLALDNSDELNESMQSKNLNASVALETSLSLGHADELHNLSFMNKKVKCLQEQVEHLTLLNKKLGELKLTNCSQCIYLKELNESRRQLKLEVQTLNQRLSELQKEYEQKCSDTEILRTKANDDYNINLNFLDSTLNGTMYDGVNVTSVEERVQNLHYELEELKENHNKLSNQYKEKCNELDKLQFENDSLTSPTEKKDTKRPKSETPSRKNSARIQTLQKNIDKLSSDLQEIKKVNANFSSTLNKVITERSQSIQEIESLKLANEELKKESNTAKESALNYEEKAKLLEEELTVLYKRVDAANVAQKDIHSQKIEIEVQLESLLKEKSELQDTLQRAEETFKKELDDFNARVHNYEKENINLKEQLQKVEDIMSQLKDTRKNNVEDRLREEIESSKSRMIKEIRSLTNLAENELKELPKKSVVDVFLFFLNAILSKETEMVKRLQEDFERSKRKLEEEKQQSIDAEKRANIWTKTVESDLEKLQGDFTEQEHKNHRLRDEIYRLEEKLKEAQYENQQLYSNIANLESDFNALQNELDKKLKANVDRDSVIIAAQEKERLARTKDEEWESRLKFEKEEHDRQLKELNEQLESYKSLNCDLKNTIEGLDLEIDHLKNTVDIKTNDYLASIRKIDEYQLEIEHMEEIQHQLKNESLEKDKHINEITGLLKIKCDLLTEYKTKVETLTPEHESLLAQLDERQICIEKFKEEIHNLKLDNKKQADILQDRLSGEEIKSAGLNKQLAELRNKNTALCTTIEEFKDRCAELERENANLQRKVRNSTSKMQVANEMLELQDENRSLKNHLEGSYNRIKELQESKSQVQRDLTEAHVKCGLLEQELNTTQIALHSLREKYNNTNLQNLREKYEHLLQEKKSIILEIEEKRMLIANKDQKLVEYSIEIDTLKKQKEVLNYEVENMKKEKSLLESKISHLMHDNEEVKKKLIIHKEEHDEAFKLVINEKNKISEELQNCQKEMAEIKLKNKELDEEMDEMVSHIHKQENEIAELQDRLITGSFSKENKEKLVALEEENEKLKLEMRVSELNCTKLQTEVDRLNTEKEQLNNRITEITCKITILESKNCSQSNELHNTLTKQNEILVIEIEKMKNQNASLKNQISNLIHDNEDLLGKITLSGNERDTAYKLVEEKNQISVELENCQKELSEIKLKNKELDEEMDDMVSHIHKQENEIAELQDRLITGSFSIESKEKLVALEEENERLKIDLRIADVNRTKLQNEIVRLNSEKEHLCSRMDDLNNKIAELEMRNLSRNSSKSNSPTTQKGRRRHRRSDLFNQNRNLDGDNDSKELTDNESPSITPTPPVTPIVEECRTCDELRIRIREMSLDLVSTNSKVTMLENQLQEKNFPYQVKCNELQDKLLVAKTKSSDLQLEIQNLRRALMKDSSRECQVCRHKKFNKRDQSVQVTPENKIYLTGMSSGIVEDHIKLIKMEKERNIMKELCRNRARKIKELEQRIKELEGIAREL